MSYTSGNPCHSRLRSIDHHTEATNANSFTNHKIIICFSSEYIYKNHSSLRESYAWHFPSYKGASTWRASCFLLFYTMMIELF